MKRFLISTTALALAALPACNFWQRGVLAGGVAGGAYFASNSGGKDAPMMAGAVALGTMSIWMLIELGIQMKLEERHDQARHDQWCEDIGGCDGPGMSDETYEARSAGYDACQSRLDACLQDGGSDCSSDFDRCMGNVVSDNPTDDEPGGSGSVVVGDYVPAPSCGGTVVPSSSSESALTGEGDHVSESAAMSDRDPVQACLWAKDSAFMSLRTDCAYDTALTQWRVYAPACDCSCDDVTGYSYCSVTVEGICNPVTGSTITPEFGWAVGSSESSAIEAATVTADVRCGTGDYEQHLTLGCEPAADGQVACGVATYCRHPF